jgi:hypothetical protein
METHEETRWDTSLNATQSRAGQTHGLRRNTAVSLSGVNSHPHAATVVCAALRSSRLVKLRSRAWRELRFHPAVAVAAAIWLMGFSGCQPLSPTETVLTDQGPMFPTLELNEDLFRSLKPSNDRDWTPEQALLPTAQLQGNQVTVHRIRNGRWSGGGTVTDSNGTIPHYDKTFDLERLTSVDLIVAATNRTTSPGQTTLSFGFDGRDFLAVSIEMRKERGQEVSPTGTVFQQYGLIYVAADERDVLQKSVLYDQSEVYLYRSSFTPRESRALFKDVMRRINKLASKPEFYDGMTNNCATNIRNHINRVQPNLIPEGYGILQSVWSDRLAYDLALIEHRGSFEETRAHSKVNYRVCLYRDDPEFSSRIRR